MNLTNPFAPLFVLPFKSGKIETTILSESLSVKKAAAHIITRTTLTVAEAETLWIFHDSEYAALSGKWDWLISRAAFETWGRPWQVSDYRVSGIGSDEFSDFYKTLLRDICKRQNAHRRLENVFYEVHKILKKKA